MIKLWRRFTGRTCPARSDGRHDYWWAGSTHQSVSGGHAYRHLMRCVCGAEYADDCVIEQEQRPS